MINLVNLDLDNQKLLEKILEWRNDNITRKFSNNTNLITPEIFEKIIGKYMESKIVPIVIYKNDVPVGIISFVNSDNKIFIGINIAPNYRGQNIGYESLNFLINNANNYFESEIIIYAQVKKINIASIKLFTKLFDLNSSDDTNILFYKKIFNLIK